MSFAISVPMPEKAPFTSPNAPFTSPLNNLTIAPPNLATRSVITLIAAPIPANATSNNSAPFLVLVKKKQVNLLELRMHLYLLN